jgi:hypothetical protein
MGESAASSRGGETRIYLTDYRTALGVRHELLTYSFASAQAQGCRFPLKLFIGIMRPNGNGSPPFRGYNHIFPRVVFGSHC